MNPFAVAAIDIGSNAARLLIATPADVNSPAGARKELLLRVPLRLGETVFSQGILTAEKSAALLHFIKACKHLMKIHRVTTFRACATAAMREAKNGEEIARKIAHKTGVTIDIISGAEESRIIYKSHIADKLSPRRRYIYVDVGGGSTEIALIEAAKFKKARSFKIGTLRLREGKFSSRIWEKLQQWIPHNDSPGDPLEIIGSGGNINKLYRLARIPDGKKLSVARLRRLHAMLANMSLEEKTSQLKLRPDRADVIVPACEIFLAIARHAGVRHINVPTMGLAEGIVCQLLAQSKQSTVARHA